VDAFAVFSFDKIQPLFIWRIVVYEIYVDIFVCLLENVVQTSFEIMRSVVVDYDDRYFWLSLRHLIVGC
jgi:hypothetical protein